MTKREICEEFNRSKDWISDYRAKEIKEKYGELSVKSVTQYLNVYEELARLFVDAVLSKEFKNRELVNFIWSEKAHSSNLAIACDRIISKLSDEEYRFPDKRTIKLLEKFQEFLVYKTEKIDKFKYKG